MLFVVNVVVAVVVVNVALYTDQLWYWVKCSGYYHGPCLGLCAYIFWVVWVVWGPQVLLLDHYQVSIYTVVMSSISGITSYPDQNNKRVNTYPDQNNKSVKTLAINCKHSYPDQNNKTKQTVETNARTHGGVEARRG